MAGRWSVRCRDHAASDSRAFGVWFDTQEEAAEEAALVSRLAAEEGGSCNFEPRPEDDKPLLTMDEAFMVLAQGGDLGGFEPMPVLHEDGFDFDNPGYL